VLNLTTDQIVSAIGISAARTFCPGTVTAGKLTNMKNTVDPWAGRMGAESALLARDGFSGPEHMIDGKEGWFAVFHHVQYKGQPATFDGEGLVKDAQARLIAEEFAMARHHRQHARRVRSPD
jgi:2-methylcitrate dehydratase PrpD